MRRTEHSGQWQPLTAQILLYQAKVLRAKKKYHEAPCAACPRFTTLPIIPKLAFNHDSTWVSTLLECNGKQEYASMILLSTDKRVKLIISFTCFSKNDSTTSLSDVCMNQGRFHEALSYEKKAIELKRIPRKQIPISELGSKPIAPPNCFELQFKLILWARKQRAERKQQSSIKRCGATPTRWYLPTLWLGLHNRRWLDVKIKDMLHETPFALMVVDIDHFKSINDELSHLVGDKRLSASLKSCVLTKFRRGIFAFDLAEKSSWLSLRTLTLPKQRCTQKITASESSTWLAWDTGERGLTVSIGITLHRRREYSQRTFYRADKALYRAKANGRNQAKTK